MLTCFMHLGAPSHLPPSVAVHYVEPISISELGPQLIDEMQLGTLRIPEEEPASSVLF